jgi:predicted transcriptional regulator
MPTNREVRLAFEKILSRLDIIDAKVSGMPQVQVQVSEKSLITLMALEKLNRPALASEVAGITGRARAFESKILNELWSKGILIKTKDGRKRVFQLKKAGG